MRSKKPCHNNTFIPIKDLFAFSLRFSIFITLIVFITIYTTESNMALIFSRTGLAFLHIYISFMVNALLYQRMIRHKMQVNEKIKFFYLFLIISILITITSLGTQFLVNKGIIPHGFNDQRTLEIFTSWKIVIVIPFISFMLSITIHFFHSFLIVLYANKQKDLEVARLQTANTETAKQLLTQQIHPHFLFNALNTLKSLIKRKPDVAEDYLIKLSDFLRASISNKRSDLVKIEEELILCNNYMSMLKTRFAEALDYQVHVPKPIQNDYLIPYFSIQPLLENAIKHNELTTSNPLKIVVDVSDGKIVVANNVQLKKNNENSTGNGLYNLNERCKILLKEELIIDQSNQQFTVFIKMLAYENSNH